MNKQLTYNNEAAITHEAYVKTFIGKYFMNYEKKKAYPIVDIEYTAGMPEHFVSRYFSVYGQTTAGKKWFLINLPEQDFHENNPLFSAVDPFDTMT